MFYDKQSKFSVELFGESHSEYIGAVICGLEKGLIIDLSELRSLLKERQGGVGSTARKEQDEVEFISGVIGGVTTGERLEIRIANKDVKKADYEDLRYIPRPSTADYPAYIKLGDKYGTGGGAFSGRMTAATVAAGGIIMQALKNRGISIDAEISSVGKIQNDGKPSFNKKVASAVEKAAKSGDTLGGVIRCTVKGVPVGVGGADFSGLESAISSAVFSIPSVKGVEFGSGFGGAKELGSKNNDGFIIKDGKVRTVTNNAGGILGGMANGEDIVFYSAFKPVPSIKKPQKTVDLAAMKEKEISIGGRHDVCAVLRACPIVRCAAAMAIYSAVIREEKGDILSLRKEIDLIDGEMVSLIKERLDIATEIGKIKKEKGVPVTDVKREEEILARLTGEYPEQAELIKKLYKEIFAESKKLQ